MADFSENVNINVELNTKGFSKLGKAVAEVRGAASAMEDFGDNFDDIESGFNSFTESLNDADFDKFSQEDDPLSDFRGSLRETNRELYGLRDGLDEEVEVNTKIDKDGFIRNIESNLNETLRDSDLEAEIAMSGELDTSSKSEVLAKVKLFVEQIETAMKADEDLQITPVVGTDIDWVDSGAAGRLSQAASEKLGGVSPKVTPEVDLSNISDEEMEALSDLADTLGVVSEAKEETSEENKVLSERNEDTANTADKEAKAFHQLIDAGSNLAEIKDAAANSNRMLSEANEEGARTALLESDGWMQLVSAGVSAEEAMDELGLKQRELNDDQDEGRSKAYRFANALDETGDSLRASAKAGDLFEDGIGSMSVNLGAFTVALRNFLTQIPLLISALGGLGSAAAGVAGAFISVGSAIGAAMAAGAIGRAQRMTEQYSQLETTGQALQVMLAGLKDMFLEAISPLTENRQAFQIFEQVAEGAAKFTSVIANSINDLMPEIDSLVDKFGDELRQPLRESTTAMAFMFRNLKDEAVDMSVGIVTAFNDMVVFVTKFTDGITESNKVVDAFTKSLAELAKLGKTVFAGFAPILVGFLGTITAIAEAINGMNAEFVSAAITVAAILFTINKFGGALGSIISLLPNLIFGLRGAKGSMTGVVEAFGGFMRQHGGYLGGFISLAESVENFNDEMAVLAIRAEVAKNGIDGVEDEMGDALRAIIMSSDSMEELNDNLASMAISAELSQQELDDMADELYQVALAAEVADEATDNMNRPDVGDIEASRISGTTPTIVPTGSGKRVGKLTTKLKGLGKTLMSLIPFVGGSSAAAFSSLATSAGGAASSLSGLLGPAALLVALFGGLLVGVIGNLDAIMSALGGTFDAIGSLMSWLAGQVIEIFIGVWDALHDVFVGIIIAVRPILDALEMMGVTGESTGSSLSALAGIIEWLVDFFVAMLDVVGSLIRVLGTIIGFILEIVLAIEMFRAAMSQLVFNAIGNFLNQFGAWRKFSRGVTGFIDDIVDAVKGFINWVGMIPELSQLVMTKMVKFFQDGFNQLIEDINKLITALNVIPGISFPKLDKVNFGISGGQGAKVSQDELDAQTNQMLGGTEPKQQPKITYEEDNSTNIDQTVNADPEDQAQLSRVVTDAIEEANSFQRRQQGGQ